MGKKKFYAVRRGRSTGIFQTWKECEASVKGFPSAAFKSFSDEVSAREFIRTGAASCPKPSVQKRPQLDHSEEESAERSQKRLKSETCSIPQATAKLQNPYQKLAAANRIGTKAQPVSSTKLVLHLMFDGGARGNPGVAGAGAFITIRRPESNNNKVLHVRDFVGNRATNNEAEYRGLVTGLRVAWTELHNWKGSGELIVQGDSNLIIQQLRGAYKVKNKNLKKLFVKAKALIEQFRDNGFSTVRFEHVYRDANGVADGPFCLLSVSVCLLSDALWL